MTRHRTNKQNKQATRKAPVAGAMSKELLAAIKNDPDGGMSYDIDDIALFPEDDVWVAAIDKLDRLGDKKPLTDLLRSNLEIPARAREYLADVIERGVARPSHRPAAPAYRVISDADAPFWLANKKVGALVKRGMLVKDALSKVAKALGLNEEQLALSYGGRRGSLNKAKRRL